MSVAFDQLRAFSSSGFTLIEVIVSMVIVSMITLIMAFTFKVNLEAWERSNNEGDKVQIEIVLPAMLERQFRYLASSTSFTNSGSASSKISNRQPNSFNSKNSPIESTALTEIGVVTQLKLVGNNQNLSFYTLYSPQGSPSKGLIRVAYIYDEDKKELNVYEKVISNQEDIDDSDGLFSISAKSGKADGRSQRTARNKSGKKSGAKFSSDAIVVAKIRDIEKFSLSFLSLEDSKRLTSSRSSSDIKMDESSFKDSWDGEDNLNPPDYIRLLFAQTKRKGGEPFVWLFKVGGTI